MRERAAKPLLEQALLYSGMNSHAAFLFASTLLLSAHAAHAQATPAAAPAAPLAPAAQAHAAADAFCDVGENIGVDVADATVASRVVCGELMSRARAKGTALSYRVNFGKLGERIILQVNEYDRSGRISDERHVQLLAIENVSAIAGRIAESIVSKRPLAELETTDNVLPEDELQRRQKQGRMHFEAGLLGGALMGSSDSTLNPGIHLGLSYELKRMFLSGALRGSGDDKNRGYSEISLGGGSFLSDNEISPYVAGGVGVLFLRDSSERYSQQATTGFAVYGEAGVGLFRTSKVSARAGLRVDVPAFRAQSDNEKNYVVPVALTVALSF